MVRRKTQRKAPARVTTSVDEATPNFVEPPEPPDRKEATPTDEQVAGLDSLLEDAIVNQILSDEMMGGPAEDAEAAAKLYNARPNDTPEPGPGPSIPGLEGVEIKRGDRHIAIEKLLAQICAAGIVIATMKLFGNENAMVMAEAQSVAEPTIRFAGRRVEGKLKPIFHLEKLSKEDRADVEEVISVLGLYMFRLFLKAIAWLQAQWVAGAEKAKQQKAARQPLPGFPPAGPPNGHVRQPVSAPPTPVVPFGVMTKQDFMADTGGDFGVEGL